MSPVVLDNTTP